MALFGFSGVVGVHVGWLLVMSTVVCLLRREGEERGEGLRDEDGVLYPISWCFYLYIRSAALRIWSSLRMAQVVREWLLFLGSNRKDILNSL